MLSPTAWRLNAACRIPHLLSRSTLPSQRALPGLARSRWTAFKKPGLSLRTKTTVVAQAGKPRYKYPEYLNVYRTGSLRTNFMGLFRMITIVLFPLGCIYAQNFYLSPDHSNWWIIPFVVGAAVPMTVMMLATGPYVHAIRVRLPPSVRMSKEELIRFVDNVPSNTILRLDCMRALPWPTKRDVKFGLLRKYRPSLKRGLSNLEYIPEHQGEAERLEGTWGHNVVKNFLGRFLVDNLVQDRSAAPGLWPKMWKQIPELGSHNDPAKKIGQEKRPLAMANRPRRVTPTLMRSPTKTASPKR